MKTIIILAVVSLLGCAPATYKAFYEQGPPEWTEETNGSENLGQSRSPVGSQVGGDGVNRGVPGGEENTRDIDNTGVKESPENGKR
jgi:hypothetical protein